MYTATWKTMHGKVIKNPEAFLTFEYCKKVTCFEGLTAVSHTKRHSMFSVGDMSPGWKNTSSHISHMTKWVLCTMWWVHISTEDHYGMHHWQGPRYFFILFHFGHRTGSFVRVSDRWARTKPHSHSPTLPITQSSVASLSQTDDGPDETWSKQTEAGREVNHFPV